MILDSLINLSTCPAQPLPNINRANPLQLTPAPPQIPPTHLAAHASSQTEANQSPQIFGLVSVRAAVYNQLEHHLAQVRAGMEQYSRPSIPVITQLALSTSLETISLPHPACSSRLDPKSLCYIMATFPPPLPED